MTRKMWNSVHACVFEMHVVHACGSGGSTRSDIIYFFFDTQLLSIALACMRACIIWWLWKSVVSCLCKRGLQLKACLCLCVFCLSQWSPIWITWSFFEWAMTLISSLHQFINLLIYLSVCLSVDVFWVSYDMVHQTASNTYSQSLTIFW